MVQVKVVDGRVFVVYNQLTGRGTQARWFWSCSAHDSGYQRSSVWAWSRWCALAYVMCCKIIMIYDCELDTFLHFSVLSTPTVYIPITAGVYGYDLLGTVACLFFGFFCSQFVCMCHVFRWCSSSRCPFSGMGLLKSMHSYCSYVELNSYQMQNVLYVECMYVHVFC